MKRVVITGLGIVSCIGNDAETVTNNLKNLNSGISSAPEYEEFAFRSLVPVSYTHLTLPTKA